MPINQALLQKKVDQYRKQFPAYKQFATFLKQVLEKTCSRLMPYAIVEARAKTIPSFAEKVIRKGDKLERDPSYDLTDRCGVRVITQTAQEKAFVCEYIRKHFDIDEANSLDKASSLREDQFGYLAVHFVVQVRDGVKEMEGLPLPDGIVTKEGKFKAEIQVKTLLEHAWAMPLHDRLYKVAIQPPASVKRDAAGLMAMVESVDSRIGQLAQQVDSFLGHYAAFLKPAKLEEEIAFTGAAIQYEKDPAKAAPLRLRLGRLMALAGRDDDALKEWNLGRSVESSSLDVLNMEYGSLLCRLHRSQPKHTKYLLGMKLLHEVADRKPDENEVDTPAQQTTRAEASHRLAWAYGNQRGQEKEARSYYRKALDLEPGNPYYLDDYLAYEVFCSGNPGIAQVMRDYVMQAIEKCRQHVIVGIEQPRAQFTMGRLYLLLDDEQRALDAYLKAISILMEPDSYTRLETLDQEIHFLHTVNLGKALPPKYELVERLLILANAAKKMQKGLQCDLKESMSKQARNGDLGEPKRALLIVGGASLMPPDKIQDYRLVIQWALEHADDLVCSGGTRVGIPGIVGEVAEALSKRRKKQFKLAGYIPKKYPEDGTPDRQRYDVLVSTDGIVFSPLEPIQGWLDFLALGLKPEQVRVLGIEGGRIAAMEYRLALALGAKVAIIPKSGRAADALLDDPDWAAHPNLLQLHLSVLDPATLRAFVRPAAINIEITQLDALAKLAHEHYLRGNLYSDIDPVRKRYAALRADLKTSNREQILYTAEILASQGYELEYVGDPDAIVQPPLDPEKIKRMAELEHGRWNIERLASGWKPGRQKDTLAKISPNLLPWDNVPRDIQQYDFNAINDYASHLQKAGYRIVDKSNPDKPVVKPLVLSVKALIIDDQGRYLVIQRSLKSKNNAGQWDLPGGKIDQGEVFTDALVREVKEETGLDIIIHRCVDSTQWELPSRIVVYLIMEAKSQGGQVRLSSEHTHYKWVTAEEFQDLEMCEQFLELVKRLAG